MTFATGSLVRARDREWVVLPDSTDQLLVLRPLGGSEDETAGVLVGLEPVEPAVFDWPDPDQAGDDLGARLFRDAARLGFRSSAGPFRSFGAIAVEPRPYQLVPLLMALRLDPVRLLIADDVGIGKTVEAALVAKELLVSGQARRLAVLCPPHLAEQWQAELSTKFHIEAELVLSSTATRLERSLGYGESVFDVYPYTIVSTDFIKSDRRRDEFLRTAPELVLVDEAHTCAADMRGRGASHQRFRLLADLAADPTGTSSWSPPRRTRATKGRSGPWWGCLTSPSPAWPTTTTGSTTRPGPGWPDTSCSGAGPTSVPTSMLTPRSPTGSTFPKRPGGTS